MKESKPEDMPLTGIVLKDIEISSSSFLHSGIDNGKSEKKWRKFAIVKQEPAVRVEELESNKPGLNEGD